MDFTKDEIKEQIVRIKDQIAVAEQKAGRTAGSIALLAVSKFHPTQSVLDALSCGQTLFGENRVQEAKAKFTEVREKGFTPTLHIIGSLQRNKIKDAVKIADCIESVDRIEVLQDIEKYCVAQQKTIQVLFEFHTGEESKSGFATYEDLMAAVTLCANGALPHIVPAGFMTMAPFTQDETIVRGAFAKMRQTAEKVRNEFPQLPLTTLSMGIGTAIFGERNYTQA